MKISKLKPLLLSKKAIPAYITIALFAIIIYLTQFYWTEAQIIEYISLLGPTGVIAYILLVTIANIAAPVSASPFLLLGFSLYGEWAIWLFALGNLGAMAINFLLARRYGRKIIAVLAGESSLDKIDELSKNYGLTALFMIRLFMPGISDLASYAFGLSQIGFKPYIIISIIATLPSNFLFLLLSNEDNSSIELLLLQLIIAGVLSGLYLGFRFLFGKFKQLLLHGRL